MSVMAPAADKKLTGLVAATFTPITTQGEINLSVIGPYIDYLKEKQGVNSVFDLESLDQGSSNPGLEGRCPAAFRCVPDPTHLNQMAELPPQYAVKFSRVLLMTSIFDSVNGTTGESMSLSVEERKILAEEWCQRAKGKMDQVIVHVGCLSLKDAQELARHAAQIEADGIAVIAPSFFKPSTADVLKTFLREVASAAPTLPFYYYHIPSVTGVNVKARELIEGIEKMIPSFRGVKFTGNDLMDLGQCISYSPPHWSVLYGMDEQLLGALAMGAHGAVGSTYNYIGCHFNKLISAFEKGDLVQARTIQFKIQELLSFAMKLGFDVGVNKQLMNELSGLDLGPPRLPLMACATAHALAIKQKYNSIFPEE